LFLDEVDSLSTNVQAKLLRFLQQREYRSVGSTAVRQSNVRVISATHSDLRQKVNDGTFREDLFYRVNVVQMNLPPLRERGDDVLLLARHFMRKYAMQFRRPVLSLSRDASARLISHPWPGNVREVENVIQAAVALAEGERIEAKDIALGGGGKVVMGSLREAKARAVHDFERSYIVKMLRTYGGNISEAARASQKKRRAFWELMRKYRVEPEEYRESEDSRLKKAPAKAVSSSGAISTNAG
jgi:DNA-binding NtrC family response regulator